MSSKNFFITELVEAPRVYLAREDLETLTCHALAILYRWVVSFRLSLINTSVSLSNIFMHYGSFYTDQIKEINDSMIILSEV